MTAWNSRCPGPFLSFNIQVLRPSVFLTSNHHNVLFISLLPENCCWSHGLSSKIIFQLGGFFQIVLCVEIEFVSFGEHCFVLHGPAVESLWVSLNDVLEIDLTELKLFRCDSAILSITNLEKSSRVKFACVSLPKANFDIGAIGLQNY